jgi:hypothetical protein
LISLLIFDTISGGVRAGNSTPYQTTRSIDGNPSSVKVGSSGAASLRLPLVTAIGRSLPERAC